jgi:hypothetical protein
MKIYTNVAHSGDWTKIADVDANKTYKIAFIPTETNAVEIHMHDAINPKEIFRVNAPGSKFIANRTSTLKFRTRDNGNYICIQPKIGDITNITMEEI